MGVQMKVYYPGGEHDGVVEINEAMFGGFAIAFPRKLSLNVCRDKEYKEGVFSHPCVYVLWRPWASDQKPLVYIGESPKASADERIRCHYREKRFWTHALVYADTKDCLSASHAEKWLLECARDAKVSVDNDRKPRLYRRQSKADADITKSHIRYLTRFFLPLAGCDFFVPHDSVTAEQKSQKVEQMIKTASGATSQSPDLLHLTARGIEAWGRKTSKGFQVCKGSQAKKDEAPSFRAFAGTKKHARIRDKLVHQEKILVPDSDVAYRFVKNYLFKSRQEAANVILGRHSYSLALWKVCEYPEGHTLGESQK